MAKGIKTGGRAEGTPNLITKELRERISDFLNEKWPQVEKDFLVLEPEKRVMLFEKLLSYTLPKLQTIGMPDIRTIESVPTLVFKDFAKEREIDLSKLSTEELIKRAELLREIEK